VTAHSPSKHQPFSNVSTILENATLIVRRRGLLVKPHILAGVVTNIQ
jgi:hypothetical protein